MPNFPEFGKILVLAKPFSGGVWGGNVLAQRPPRYHTIHLGRRNHPNLKFGGHSLAKPRFPNPHFCSQNLPGPAQVGQPIGGTRGLTPRVHPKVPWVTQGVPGGYPGLRGYPGGNQGIPQGLPRVYPEIPKVPHPAAFCKPLFEKVVPALGPLLPSANHFTKKHTRLEPPSPRLTSTNTFSKKVHTLPNQGQ